MSPFAIIIHLHVFKNSSFRFFPSPELVSVNQFDLERVKEALSDGVVPAIALPAHASDELVLGQYRLKRSKWGRKCRKWGQVLTLDKSGHLFDKFAILSNVKT